MDRQTRSHLPNANNKSVEFHVKGSGKNVEVEAPRSQSGAKAVQKEETQNQSEE
jgi:hypothetical protein